MRALRLATGATICALAAICAAGGSAASHPGHEAEVVTVVEGAEDVTGIAFISDGRMVFAQRSGAVFIVQDGALRDEPIATVPTSVAGGGVLALAAGPDVAVDSGVYALAAEEGGRGSAVFRIALDLQSAPEIVVDGLPSGSGALAFRDDGGLLVASGDRLLELSDPAGASGAGAELAHGLRSARGVAVEPGGGRTVVTDASGAHLLEAQETRSLGFDPGPAAFGDGRAPEPYAGGLLIASRRRPQIFLVHLDAGLPDEVVVDAGAPVTALAWGPAGLYFAAGGRISAAVTARDVRPAPAVTLRRDPARGALAPRNRWVFVVVTAAFVAAYLYGRRRLLR